MRTDFKGVIKESVLLFLAALMLAVPAMHVQAAQTDGANDSLRKVKTKGDRFFLHCISTIGSVNQF